jgi:hypothetical protein
MRAVLLISFFLITGVTFAQTVPPVKPVGIEEAYLAKDDGEGKAGEQVQEFNTTDVPIYCVILLDTIEATVVKMNFVAVSVAGVKPDTKVVTASYTTREGENRVNFTGRPDRKWTPGRYRVDVFLDGKIAKNLLFDIKSTAGGSPGAASFRSPRTRIKQKTGKN